MTAEIKGFFGEHRWLSNFWLCPVTYDGRIYPSSENAYQAAKFTDAPEEFCTNMMRCTPGQAKRLGRTGDIRVGWDSIKFKIRNFWILVMPIWKKRIIGVIESGEFATAKAKTTLADC